MYISSRSSSSTGGDHCRRRLRYIHHTCLVRSTYSSRGLECVEWMEPDGAHVCTIHVQCLHAEISTLLLLYI
jgi:hypothetical protein